MKTDFSQKNQFNYLNQLGPSTNLGRLTLEQSKADKSLNGGKKKELGRRSETEETEPQEVTMEDEENDTQSCMGRFKLRIYKFIESTFVIIFMMVVTFWVLFADDIRQLTSDSEKDDYFYYVILVCFGLFVIEIILTFYSSRDYRWTFFFYLDVISTLTLLFDVAWISDAVFGQSSKVKNPKNAANFAKTARASRIGTRVARVVRIIRLIRLIRVSKLYKASKQAQLKKEDRKKEIKKRNQEMLRKKQMELMKENQEQANLFPGGEAQKMQEENQPAAFLGASIAGSPASGVRKKGSSLDVSLSKGGVDDSASNISRLGASSNMSAEELEELEDESIFKETNVGKQLSELTTKRVIILILSIMISIPIFSIDTYWPDYSSYQSGLQNLSYLLKKNTNIEDNKMFQKGWQAYVNFHTRKDSEDILRKLTLIRKNVNLPDDTEDLTSQIEKMTGTYEKLEKIDQRAFEKLRAYEKKTIVEPSELESLENGAFSMVAIFDVKDNFDLNSYLSIGRTVFVLIVLSTSAIFFSKDANELVLDPIENMLKKVKRISRNPLRAARIEEEETIYFEDFNTNKKKLKDKVNKHPDNYETMILEKTIGKIGALLALGFGEAGSEIIAKNMQGGGDIDPMIPGKKVVAVFGFCDIRNFTDVTEVLQEGVAQGLTLGDGFC